jgi:NAD(P)-dependent dehydrogenase (short-subunit alcohol dehydrogenase family)
MAVIGTMVNANLRAFPRQFYGDRATDPLCRTCHKCYLAIDVHRCPIQEGTMTLDGKVAIITGASRGIGFAIAKRFHEAGASVALCARSFEDLARHEEALGPQRAMAVAMDIRNRESVSAGIQRIVDRFEKLDIVVNNAGISGVTPIDSDASDLWLDIIQTNIVGSYYVTRAAVPHIPENGRVIVTFVRAGKVRSPRL